MRLALHQPDIAGNVGTIMRMCACFGVPLDIIMPCGFAFTDKGLRRASMDYAQGLDVVRHATPEAFFAVATASARRIVLLTAAGDMALPAARFHAGDTLLFGSESAGVPAELHDRAELRVRIPLRPGFRSLNIAVAAGIALGEALRQTGRYPQ